MYIKVSVESKASQSATRAPKQLPPLARPSSQREWRQRLSSTLAKLGIACKDFIRIVFALPALEKGVPGDVVVRSLQRFSVGKALYNRRGYQGVEPVRDSYALLGR